MILLLRFSLRGEMIPASDSGRSVDRQTTRLVKIRVVDESIMEQVVSELERSEVQHFLDSLTPQWQATAERCPLHRDSAEILRFAAETCLLISTTNRFISLSHGETDGENPISALTFWDR